MMTYAKGHHVFSSEQKVRLRFPDFFHGFDVVNMSSQFTAPIELAKAMCR
jgi:hypothetical protein